MATATVGAAPKAEPCWVEYKLSDGVTTKMFDISMAATEKFDLLYQDRVKLPTGQEAVVVGVREGCIFFHPDGGKGAICYPHIRDAEGIRSNKVEKVRDSTAAAINLEEGYHEGEHKVKRVSFKGRDTSIIMQNENGPCPLVAISNILLLRGDISLDQDVTVVTVQRLCQNLATYVRDHPPAQDANLTGLHNDFMANIDLYLLQLQSGLDVNPKFQGVDSYAENAATSLFALFRCGLFHAWLVDPKSEQSIVATYSYDELSTRLVTVESEESPKKQRKVDEDPQPVEVNEGQAATAEKEGEGEAPAAKEGEDGSPAAAAAAAPEAEGSATPAEEEGGEEQGEGKEGAPTPSPREEARIIRRFLEETGGQVTPYGLARLETELEEGAPCVYFRNNHFATLIKNGGRLFTLVTDVGYWWEPHVIWESLDMSNDTTFLDSSFVPASERQREDVIDKICHHHSYTKEQVGSAYDELAGKTGGQEVTLTPVLDLLKVRHGNRENPYAASDPASAPAKDVNQDDVNRLMEMGYTRLKCEGELRKSKGNLEQALEALLTGA